MKKTNPKEYKKIIRKIIKVDLDAIVNNSDYLRRLTFDEILASVKT